MKYTEEATLELTERLADVMVNQLFENKSFKTGGLANSIKKNNRVEKTTDGFIGVLTMDWYGSMVDAGVKGSVNNKGYNNKKISGQPFESPGQFKSKAIPKSSGLPTPVRWSLARYGFAPKPFINTAINITSQRFGKEIMDIGVEKDINDGIMDAYNK